ncbi:MAG: FtsX-like permease family protein [Vicinamibacterales bacterium]
MVAGFALLAWLLAATGLYAVLALFVSTRTRELGVRVALGATPAGIGTRVVRESLGDALVGVAAGLVLALASGRLLEGLLVGVGGADLPTLAVVTCGMLAAAALASLPPVLRATRVDPVVALRSEF